MGPVGLVDIYQYIERAVKVAKEFHFHQQYVVKDDEIVIVDEFTGRMAEGRKWSGGIHQSVEAKEGVEITVETGHAARVTVQDLFRRYKFLAGMTGTAATSARELKKIYELQSRFDSHQPPRPPRRDCPIWSTPADDKVGGHRGESERTARDRPSRADWNAVDR